MARRRNHAAPLAGPTPAIAYARFSPRPNAQECDSIEKQESRILAYCLGLGYNLCSQYSDSDASGGSLDGRPALRLAIDDAIERQAVLVVYDLSRLARNTRDALAILDELHAGNADLAMIAEGISTRHPMGRVLFTIIAAMRELDRSQTAERTSMAMRRLQAKGRRMGRPDRLPYGTKLDHNSPTVIRNSEDTGIPSLIVPCHEEQLIIDRIMFLRATGLGWRAIANNLNDNHILRRGQEWKHPDIARIWHNESAIIAAKESNTA
jgi:site-specific DNA recombinase